jgi:integrase
LKRRCLEAGLDADLAAHGLRKLGATRCAEAGATEYELMALFGWSSSKLAALYTRKANRGRLEAGAAPLLMWAEPKDNKCPTFRRGANRWDKKRT